MRDLRSLVRQARRLLPPGRTLTAADLIYDIVIAENPSESVWHTQRGPVEANGLAERPAPARRSVTSRGVTPDSAQVLHAAFTPIDGPPALQLFAHFYDGFVRWAADDPRATGSRTFHELRAVGALLLAARTALSSRWVDVIVAA